MSEAPRKPCKKRFSLMIFMFVYPLVTVLLYAIAALTPDWQLWQRALVMVPMVVVAMVYVIIPLIQMRLTALITVRA